MDKAISIIKEEAEKHPLALDNRTPEDKAKKIPKVSVRLISLGDFSVNLKAYVWAKNNDDAFVIECDLLDTVKKRYDKEGVEIPFPYRTIVFKKDIKNDQENT